MSKADIGDVLICDFDGSATALGIVGHHFYNDCREMEGYPIILTRLGKMMSWINEKIGENLDTNSEHSKPVSTQKPIIQKPTEIVKPSKPEPTSSHNPTPQNISPNVPQAIHNLIGYKFRNPVEGELLSSQSLDKFSTNFKISFEIEVELEARLARYFESLEN